MRRGPTAVVLIAALASSAIGCGGGSHTTTERNRPEETAQKLPKLPAGWKARRDRSI